MGNFHQKFIMLSLLWGNPEVGGDDIMQFCIRKIPMKIAQAVFLFICNLGKRAYSMIDMKVSHCLNDRLETANW